jgi:hypothetical protein
VRVVNHGTTAQTLDLSIVTTLDAPGVAFSIVGPTSINVPAAGSTTFNVRINADTTLMKRRRDPSMSPVQNVAAPAALAGLGALPRHFMSEESGLILLRQGAAEVVRLPVYSAVRPHSNMSAPGLIVTGGAPTGTASLMLSGTDVCTAPLVFGACGTNVDGSDQVSLVGGFELQVDSPRNDTLPAFADIHYVGVGHDPAVGGAGGTYLFGFASWGEWGTLGNVSYNVCVDTNEDGTYEKVLFNSDLGQMARGVFGQTTISGQDTFITGVLTLPSSVAVGGTSAFVNHVSAAVADTAAHTNDVFSMGVTATQLGLVAPDAKFRYAVVTCPGFNPLCVRNTACTSTGNFDIAAGPFAYDSAARGLDFGTGAGWRQDLNTNALTVSWNTANMTANGSLGGLLLHTHNTSGNRAQVLSVVPVDTFANGFANGFED